MDAGYSCTVVVRMGGGLDEEQVVAEYGRGDEMRGAEEAECLPAPQHRHTSPVHLAIHFLVAASLLSPSAAFA